jgi:hypothetical protein
MLIIAMPKSASSSLARSLSDATGVPVANRAARAPWKARPRAASFPLMAAIHHGDAYELAPSDAEALAAIDGVAKHHILPTANNTAVLAGVRRIVLLRDPDEVIDAYWRGYATGVWPDAFKVLGAGRTIEEWRAAARTAGLDAELERFAGGWRQAPGETLLLDYAGLTADSDRTLRQALDFFGYSEAAVPALAREKFTRDKNVPLVEQVRRSFTRLKSSARVALRRSRPPQG